MKVSIKTVNILGVPIAAIGMKDTVGHIKEAIINNHSIHHTVVNAAKFALMSKNPVLSQSVIKADLINADGQAVIWASRILNKPLPERVAGIDLMENLVKLAHDHKFKIYFLGAKKNILDKVIDIYSTKYSPEIIGGYRDGYFCKDEEAVVANEISISNSNILFVAMSSPKKEIFLYENRDQLKNINFIMGVGGSFDVVAGKVTRAPIWIQKIGMEWLYRLLQEPGRLWKRYLVNNSIFIWMVFKELVKRREVK